MCGSVWVTRRSRAPCSTYISTKRTCEISGSFFRRSVVMTQMTQDESGILEKRTKAQWRFWLLLQDEQNRSLSVVELCRRAGYAGTKQWFTSLKDEGFRAQLESLGVPTRRREVFVPGPVTLEDPDKVWGRDRVDLRRLDRKSVV